MRIDYDELIRKALRDRDVLDLKISELKKQNKEQDEYERTIAININLDDIRENGIADFSVDNFANIMRAIDYQLDEEQGHILADDVMCLFLRHYGYANGCNVFENMSKRYS